MFRIISGFNSKLINIKVYTALSYLCLVVVFLVGVTCNNTKLLQTFSHLNEKFSTYVVPKKVLSFAQKSSILFCVGSSLEKRSFVGCFVN